MDVGPAHSVNLPLLSVWMEVVSLIPYLSDFHSTQFLTVLSDGCSNFSGNFDVVVQRGEPCLLTPPSWPVVFGLCLIVDIYMCCKYPFQFERIF